MEELHKKELEGKTLEAKLALETARQELCLLGLRKN